MNNLKLNTKERFIISEEEFKKIFFEIYDEYPDENELVCPFCLKKYTFYEEFDNITDEYILGGFCEKHKAQNIKFFEFN